LSVDVPEDLHRDLRVECARLGIKNYEVVRRALAEAVSKLRGHTREEAAVWIAG
jgi:hypothetical protein